VLTGVLCPADLLDVEAEEVLEDSGFESEGDSMSDDDSMAGSQAEDSQHSSDMTDSESEPESILQLGSSARRSGYSPTADSQAADSINSSAQREEEDQEGRTDLHRAAGKYGRMGKGSSLVTLLLCCDSRCSLCSGFWPTSTHVSCCFFGIETCLLSCGCKYQCGEPGVIAGVSTGVCAGAACMQCIATVCAC
jgi:hypothetical protein